MSRVARRSTSRSSRSRAGSSTTPKEIWARTQEVIDEALDSAGASADDIAGLGITNQRETAVVWDKTTGEPIHNAIVWQDTRTDKLVDELSADGGQDRFQEQAGLPLATYFSGPKVRWILDNVDGAREKAESGDLLFGNMDTWVIWNLTGGTDGGLHITDVTNASRTMLMDLNDAGLGRGDRVDHRRPDVDAARDQGVERGLRRGQAAARSPGVQIAGDLGDQQAATFGQTCFAVGEAKNTYGTGNFLLLNTGTEAVQSKNGLLTTVGYKIGDNDAVYCLEGSIAITGALVQWLRDNLKMIKAAPEVEELAKTVDDNGGCYIVPAFSGLFAPYWKSNARGVIAGLTRYVNAGHIARATLEATAYQSREVVEAMNAGLRRRPRVAEGRRRHGAERPAHAVPGRPARRAGHPAGGGRDHGARRGVRRGPGDRVLGRAVEDLRENWAGGQALGAQDGLRQARRVLQVLEEGRHADLRLVRERVASTRRKGWRARARHPAVRDWIAA